MEQGTTIRAAEDVDVPEDVSAEAIVVRPRRRWRRILLVVFLLFVALVGWLAWNAPLSRALEPLPNPALVFLDAGGRPIARTGAYKEAPVEVAKLPDHVVDAVLSIEDRRFYDHVGIDVRGLARAAYANLQAGGVVQGGSTITQQLAKTAFLTNQRSLSRKGQEVIMALWLEAWLTKDEILSRYLSSVYFGDGNYGLRAAARHYFNRRPEDLTLAQAAMLAGIIKAPSAMAPSRHLKRAQKRSEVVLQAMADNGKISQSRARATRPAKLNVGRAPLPAGSYFADWVRAQDRDAFDRARYGELRVQTTLDSRLQREAERIARRTLDRKAYLDAGQVALVAMRPTGEVVAMVGGRDYSAGAFNRATQAKRQPGSAFKLFVYLAALRKGYDITTQIEDTPVTIGDWSPRNHEGKYRGTISLITAFAASSNVATARIANDVGRAAIVRAARDLGVKSELGPNLDIALGTSDMTLMELTAAYAAVAAGRYPVVPRGLPKGKPGWRERLAAVTPFGRMREQAAMERMLESAVRTGTGIAARLPIKAYGKTGTTQDYRDAVFVGYAGDLVVGVWVGNDDNKPMDGVTGGGLPAEIWRDFMRAAAAYEPSLRHARAVAAPDHETEEDLARELEQAILVGGDTQARAEAAIEAVRAIGDIVDEKGAPEDIGERAEAAAAAIERAIEAHEQAADEAAAASETEAEQ